MSINLKTNFYTSPRFFDDEAEEVSEREAEAEEEYESEGEYEDLKEESEEEEESFDQSLLSDIDSFENLEDTFNPPRQYILIEGEEEEEEDKVVVEDQANSIPSLDDLERFALALLEQDDEQATISSYRPAKRVSFCSCCSYANKKQRC
jgi:hypothetical protein